MGTIEITRVEDVREGDVVTLSFAGHEFTGRAWSDPENEGLNVGSVALKWYGTADEPARAFVRATREVPDLPTEPGSVIVNATIRGEAGHTAILNTNGDWFTTTHVEGYWCHTPEHITAWEPGRVVSESEEDFGPVCCTDGCCGPGSHCCAHANPHTHEVES